MKEVRLLHLCHSKSPDITACFALVAQWLKCSTAAETLLMTQVKSAFRPSEVGKFECLASGVYACTRATVGLTTRADVCQSNATGFSPTMEWQERSDGLVCLSSLSLTTFCFCVTLCGLFPFCRGLAGGGPHQQHYCPCSRELCKDCPLFLIFK